MALIDNKYERISRRGEGGQGSVWKARHVDLDQIRAIKEISDDALRHPEFLRRFKEEARTVARLNHPNIVQIYDQIFDGTRYYQVYRYVDGPNLSEYVRSHGALGVADALEVARQIAAGLEHAHERGVVHRDVKPANVMVESIHPWRVLLTDFGIAKVDDGGELTRTNQMVGTPKYSAPEQLGWKRGTGRDKVRVPADARTDIFSLGLVLFELIEGRQFFAGLDQVEIMGRVVYDPEPLVPDFTRALSNRIVRLVERMLERDPNDRPQNMTEVLREIGGCAAELAPLDDGDRTVSIVRRDDTIVDSTPTGSSTSPSSLQQASYEALKSEMDRRERMQRRERALQVRSRAEAAREQADAVRAADLVPADYRASVALEEQALAALEKSSYDQAAELFTETVRAFAEARTRAAAEAEVRRRQQLREQADAA